MPNNKKRASEEVENRKSKRIKSNEDGVRRSARLAKLQESKKGENLEKKEKKRNKFKINNKRIGESSIQYEATKEEEKYVTKAKKERLKNIKFTKDDVITPTAALFTAVAAKTKEKVSKEIQERKKKSEAILKKHKIPILESLPYVGRGHLREIQEIKNRLVILFNVAMIGGLFSVNLRAVEPHSKETISDLKKKHKIWNELTEEEKTFLKDPTSTSTSFNHNDASFSLEGVWILLWALNIIEDDIGYPKEMCETTNLDFHVPLLMEPMTLKKFQQIARKLTGNKSAGTLRSLAEIEDKQDLAYRTHWAYTDRMLLGPYSPKDLTKNLVAREWHRALGWLTSDDKYDEVDLST